MTEELPYAILDRLLGNRHKAETPCPLCSPLRKAHHRKTPCFGMFRSGDKIVFNCMHCGAQGARTNGWKGEDQVESRPIPPSEAKDYGAYARELWEQSVDPRGTDTERYWLHRGLSLPIPPTIRHLPGMMIAIAGLPILAGGSWSDAEWYPPEACLAVQRTYLKPGGLGRTEKKALGPIKGLPVCVHCNPESLALVVGEGIETTHRLAAWMNVDGWASCGVTFYRHLAPTVPNYVEVVTIIYDEKAEPEIRELDELLKARGIEVRVVKAWGTQNG